MASEISVPVIDRVIELQPARLIDVGDYTYIDKDKTVTMFVPPAPKPISVTTLNGFMGLLEAGYSEGFSSAALLVQVEAFDKVSLIAKTSDEYGRRQTLVEVKALPAERKFEFNRYYTQEEFNIALRSMFVQTYAVDELVKLAGNLAHKADVKQEDDGFTQRMTAKAGIVRVAEITAKPRVTLHPFRTFSEVEQPDGEFIFRVKHDELKGNMCALFEADGGFWKQAAMNTVRSWLQNRLAGSSNLDLNGLPVIA